MAATAFQPRPAEGLKYPNVVRMFEARLARSPHGPALRHKVAGVWRTLSWKQWWDEAREVAAGLIATYALAPGDTVAVLSPTRVEWILADLAIALCGAISVPIYPSLTPGHVAFILRDSACRVVLTDQDRRLDGVELHGARVCAFEAASGTSTWIDLRGAGVKALADGKTDAELQRRIESTDLQTTMTHVYTSGTTGEPKGVVLTHENLVYEAWAIKNVVPVDETDEQLLVLPLAHIFARHLVWGAVENGAVTAVGEGEPQIAANLLEVAPTFMGAVPRLYEMAHARVMREVIGRSPVTRRGFELALDVGRRLSAFRQRGQVPPTSLQLRGMVADRLFFSKIRGLFGGRLRFFVCGGAALNQEIAEFFHACGVLILEGYGLSETTGATNVNRPDRFRFGTVGPAMPGCEIRIADDGEVLVRGHNVMRGYHNLPEETKAAFDEHGWLRTGDIGELRDGFLRITDRKKSLFKTTVGKYVAPRMIEGRLRVKEGIAHVLVHGEGRPYPIALVSLDVEALLQRSDEEGLGCRTYADLAVHPRVQALVQEHIDAVNATLARYEAVRRFAIVSRPFTVESGEVTPTRKLRRTVIAQRYASLIDELYETEDVLHPAESAS